MSEHLSDCWGRCHCGNLRLSLRLSQAPADTRLRACGCSFCRAHNTRTTSDPNGSVDIHATNWSLVQSYRFWHGYRRVPDLQAVWGIYRRHRRDRFGHPRRHQHQLLGQPGRLHPATRSRRSRWRGDRRPAGATRRQVDAGDDPPAITKPGWNPSQVNSITAARFDSDHTIFRQNRELRARQSQFAAEDFRIVLAD